MIFEVVIFTWAVVGVGLGMDLLYPWGREHPGSRGGGGPEGREERKHPERDNTH